MRALAIVLACVCLVVVAASAAAAAVTTTANAEHSVLPTNGLSSSASSAPGEPVPRAPRFRSTRARSRVGQHPSAHHAGSHHSSSQRVSQQSSRAQRSSQSQHSSASSGITATADAGIKSAASSCSPPSKDIFDLMKRFGIDYGTDAQTVPWLLARLDVDIRRMHRFLKLEKDTSMSDLTRVIFSETATWAGIASRVMVPDPVGGGNMVSFTSLIPGFEDALDAQKIHNTITGINGWFKSKDRETLFVKLTRDLVEKKGGANLLAFPDATFNSLFPHEKFVRDKKPTEVEAALCKELSFSTKSEKQQKVAFKALDATEKGLGFGHVGWIIADILSLGTAAIGHAIYGGIHAGVGVSKQGVKYALWAVIGNRVEMFTLGLRLLQEHVQSSASSVKCSVDIKKGKSCPADQWCQIDFAFETQEFRTRQDKSQGFCMPRFGTHRQKSGEDCMDHSDCETAYCDFEPDAEQHIVDKLIGVCRQPDGSGTGTSEEFGFKFVNGHPSTRRRQGDCDCHYDKDGCRIVKKAPRNNVCHCYVSAVSTCQGRLKECNVKNALCREPTSSIHACLLGGGDCAGYHACDCSFVHFHSGCKLSKAPPSNMACKCVRHSFECVGNPLPCPDEDDDRCKHPRANLATCKFGGGDCYAGQDD